jgi:hypothetical protein
MSETDRAITQYAREIRRLEKRIVELESSDQTPALRALVEQWRKLAQSKRDKAHFRDDPYDDMGHEYRLHATWLEKSADELSALLSSSPAERTET